MITLKHHTINLYIALLFLAVTPAFGADSKPWNTQEALQLSDQLYTAARQLNTECRQSPPKYLDEGTTNHLAFRYHVRHLMSVADDLSQALENGDNREQTQPIFNSAASIVADLKQYTSAKMSGKWPPVTNAVQKVDGVLGQLGAYYSQP